MHMTEAGLEEIRNRAHCFAGQAFADINALIAEVRRLRQLGLDLVNRMEATNSAFRQMPPLMERCGGYVAAAQMQSGIKAAEHEIATLRATILGGGQAAEITPPAK
jgi:hypothetical protein